MKTSLIVSSLLSIKLFAYGFTENSSTNFAPLPHRYLHPVLRKATSRPLTQNLILPKHPVTPFFQWMKNNGYCGEVNLIQAGMNQGQWMSQYNARLICGTGLSQSGPDGFCSVNGVPNYNAQILFENQNPGDNIFANTGLCLKNARLNYQLFDYSTQAKGIPGYQQFLTWVKAELIAGNQVSIGILDQGGSDPQYDHEVTVTQIGTKHDKSDSHYYDDDVLYFDDHVSGIQSYTFQSLAKTRAGANAGNANDYSILIPGVFPTYSGTGGDGIHTNPHAITAANYAFSVSGPADIKKETLPVTLTIIGSTSDGTANAPDPTNGFNFESPGLPGNSCTNNPPQSWMGIGLKVEVGGLTPGIAYRLYEYDFGGISGIGTAAALAVPESDFNAHSDLASKVTSFVATGVSYAQTIQSTSDKIIVFRCVKADAP